MRKFFGGFIMFIGAILILGSLALAVYNIYDENRANEAVDVIRNELIPEIPNYSSEIVIPNGERVEKNSDDKTLQIPLYELNPELEMKTVTVATIESIGMLRIPALNLELPVTADWSYNNLRYAPCCYSGSAYDGNFVICAHNYKGHFGDIQYLNTDDDVIFTDVEGNNFFYKVDYIDLLEPTDIEEMTSEDYDLTLFTCTFTGQARVTVRCTKIEE